jgi:hypothetical protein
MPGPSIRAFLFLDISGIMPLENAARPALNAPSSAYQRTKAARLSSSATPHFPARNPHPGLAVPKNANILRNNYFHRVK